MRRFGDLLGRMLDYDNMRSAYLKALKGNSRSADAVLFSQALNRNLDSLRHDLSAGEYAMGPYHQFVIHDPKERLISAACFRDRVAHHAIMNVLEPIFERKQIFHSYACRRGKGAHAAVRALSGKSRPGQFFLKLDVRKYFDSISHEILVSMLAGIIKDEGVLDILRSIIGSYAVSDGRGLPIGNLTSQHFANLYLSVLDHHALEKLKPEFYVRYMDDMVFLDCGIDSLKGCLHAISRFASERLSLTLKQPVFGSVSSGAPFLGHLVSPRHIRLLGKSMRRKVRRLEDIERLCRSGRIDFAQAMLRRDSIMEYLNHLV